MKIVLASRNPKKIGELRTLLAETLPEVEVLSLDEVGIFQCLVCRALGRRPFPHSF